MPFRCFGRSSDGDAASSGLLESVRTRESGEEAAEVQVIEQLLRDGESQALASAELQSLPGMDSRMESVRTDASYEERMLDWSLGRPWIICGEDLEPEYEEAKPPPVPDKEAWEDEEEVKAEKETFEKLGAAKLVTASNPTPTPHYCAQPSCRTVAGIRVSPGRSC